MINQSVKKAALLNPQDSVALALEDIPEGATISINNIQVSSNIPRGHKIAVKDIDAGAEVIKYAQVIGFAKEKVAQGDHIHSHNCGVDDFERDYDFCADTGSLVTDSSQKNRVFKGYRSAAHGRRGVS